MNQPPGCLWNIQQRHLAGQRADITVLLSLSFLSCLSLFCVEDRSTVLLGMLGPDSERPQSGVWWSNPHHFPPQEKEETLLRVSRLLFNHLSWPETHLHPIYGWEWQSASTTKFKPIRTTRPERKSLHTEAPSPPREHPQAQPTSQPTALPSLPARRIHIAHSARMLSRGFSQCRCWHVGTKSKPVLHLSLPWTWSW